MLAFPAELCYKMFGYLNFYIYLCSRKLYNLEKHHNKMKYSNAVLGFALAVIMASCSASKKVPYIIGAEQIPEETLSSVTTITDPVLSPGDLLNIEVTSTDMAAVVPFNKGMYITNEGMISRIQTMQTNQTSNNNNYIDYYLIDQDGTIDFPMLGRIQAAGLTKIELSDEITNEIYPRYVKERPKVEVRLMNFKVYVMGAVRNPGSYSSNSERMNFLEALSLAGDLDIKGDRENIVLYRTNADGTREVHRINLQDRNFLMSPYFNLQQNDVIYVTPNKSLANTAWQLNPGVSATMTYLGGISSLASLVIGIINLTQN